MNDDVIRMGKEAGIGDCYLSNPHPGVVQQLKRFAELVRADEREACAAIAENVGTATEPDDFALDKCYEIEAAIRARGQA